MNPASGNLYPGVNAHLNSFLQQRGAGWESFHSRHINDIQERLDQILPPNYYSLTEKSLQISTYGSDAISTFKVAPDVAVYQRRRTEQSTHPQGNATPTLTLPMRRVLVDLEEEDISSVIIYEAEEGQVPGKPVVRIELLSPANKPGGSDYLGYLGRRMTALRAEITLIEIDYLHKQRSILPAIPDYSRREEGATPYLVLVSKPHPSLYDGEIDFYQFGVDEPIPNIAIPLVGEDHVALDLGNVYHHAFTAVRIFRELVDYSQDPPFFDKFTPEDQGKIRTILSKIRGE